MIDAMPIKLRTWRMSIPFGPEAVAPVPSAPNYPLANVKLTS